MFKLQMLAFIGCLSCYVIGDALGSPPRRETSPKEPQESRSALVVVQAPGLTAGHEVGHEVGHAVVSSTRLQVKDPLATEGYVSAGGKDYLIYNARDDYADYSAPVAARTPGEDFVYIKPVYGSDRVVQDVAYTKATPEKVIFEGVKYVRRPEVAKLVSKTSAPGHHPDRVLPYLGGHSPSSYGSSSLVGRSPYASAVYLAPYGLESGLGLYGFRTARWTLSSKWLKRSTPIYSSVYTGPASKNEVATGY